MGATFSEKVAWALREAWDTFWFCFEYHDQLHAVEMEATERAMMDAVRPRVSPPSYYTDTGD